jgi:tetraacyldisaccharide 4'-kinase
MNVLRFALYPLALLYGLAIYIRHRLFDAGIFHSKKYNIPVIGVGNLTVGGTGKTPMVEYLIQLLADQFKTATLSRGYERKSKGFVLATQYSDVNEIGDEPLQYYRKFRKSVTVAVDENRREGIEFLMQNDSKLELILLDDSFQHRYVSPGINILLTDFYNVYPEDHLLPVGKLRDLKRAAKRADIIIVTKTDRVMSPILRKGLIKLINPLPHQKVFFSFLEYGDYQPVSGLELPMLEKKPSVIVLLTGIANPWPLQDYLISRCTELVNIEYQDHHQFTRKDIEHILNVFNDQFAKNKILLTTEKDMMRLIKSPYFSRFKDVPLYYIPVKVRFHNPDSEAFDQIIIDYVSKNKRDS